MGGGGERRGAARAGAATATANGADDIAASAPALHVVVLGAGGGPLESNVTALLVRSVQSGWSKGSVVAVDAGVHLGAIKKILDETQPPGLGETEEYSLPYTLKTGPFAGLEVPHRTSEANAGHIHNLLIDTYLITHPHLDHISGFVINTAGLPGNRPKRLAGLPSTISAFKTHIFNNVIWPNLSDENNGAGLVTYHRLVEGGSPALGEGDAAGYLEISDGLAVKVMCVSHGHCIERHAHRGSSSTRHPSFDAGAGGIAPGVGTPSNLSTRALAHHNSASHSLNAFLMQQQQRDQERLLQAVSQNLREACATGAGGVAGGGAGGRTGSLSVSGGGPGQGADSVCVYDSSAYFVRDVDSGREILIFGDVEPDSISYWPRNRAVWQEAAPKLAAGRLAAIFIECSFDDSQAVERLFGHLAPRYLVEEMLALADEVEQAKRAQREAVESAAAAAAATASLTAYSAIHSSGDKKRKREDGELPATKRKTTPQPHAQVRSLKSRNGSIDTSAALATKTDDPISPRTVKPQDRRTSTGSGYFGEQPHNGHHRHPLYDSQSRDTDTPHLTTPTAELTLAEVEMSGPVTPVSAPPPALSAGEDGSNTSDDDERGPNHHVEFADDVDSEAGQLDGTCSSTTSEEPLPLAGLKVVVIHVKNKLSDARPAGEVILEQLRKRGEEAGLGCEFMVSSVGQDLYL